MNPNTVVLIAVVAAVLLLVRRSGRRVASAHRRFTSGIRSMLLLAGLLVLGMWLLNTRYGGA